jgi:diaminohydroxyphosphoribosylaminopyrimidine deaminase/5-amino-6-(5-phosphoribosylamino)uracil reductase
LFTAQRPLGRAGRPALSAEALAALGDPARYGEAEAEVYGPDTLRRWERVSSSVPG